MSEDDSNVRAQCSGADSWWLTGLLILLFAWAQTPFAQELPKPGPFQQRDMEQRGLSYADWLLSQGILKQDVILVTHALQAGANANRFDATESPPLFKAVGVPGAKPEIVALLVKHGAQVNARYEPTPPDCKGVPFLERMNCEMHRKTGTASFFPLYDAARSSNARVVETLIEHGADVRARVSSGETALFATHDAEIAKVLVRHGTDINARRASGESVLGLARQFALQLKNSNSYMRPQVEAYVAWLESQGAIE